MASTDLSPRRIALEEQHADERRAALERLGAEAETAELARAHEIMVQAAAIKDVLDRARGTFEDARLAGVTSVKAARRVGSLLEGLSSKVRASGRHGGTLPSDRGLAMKEIGVSPVTGGKLRRLSRIPDPDYQRYIQRPGSIPSMHGALYGAHDTAEVAHRERARGLGYSSRRRRVHQVKTPANASLDEGYRLLGLVLGHFGAATTGGGARRASAVSHAMQLGYQMADLVRPYTSGYGDD